MRVRCTAVRYLPTGTLPGVVEAYLTDASGFRWQLVEKTALFDQFDALESPDLVLPMDVTIRCRIDSDQSGPTVTIDILDIGDGRTYSVARSSLIPDEPVVS
jgi:hypothetical protein